MSPSLPASSSSRDTGFGAGGLVARPNGLRRPSGGAHWIRIIRRFFAPPGRWGSARCHILTTTTECALVSSTDRQAESEDVVRGIARAVHDDDAAGRRGEDLLVGGG